MPEKRQPAASRLRGTGRFAGAAGAETVPLVRTMSSGDDPALSQELVADKYRLTRLLGRGGMGSVWEGVHTTLGTRVAVKFIEAEYVESREARSRFENEAHAAAKLRSKHVVQVFDHG